MKSWYIEIHSPIEQWKVFTLSCLRTFKVAFLTMHLGPQLPTPTSIPSQSLPLLSPSTCAASFHHYCTLSPLLSPLTTSFSSYFCCTFPPLLSPPILSFSCYLFPPLLPLLPLPTTKVSSHPLFSPTHRGFLVLTVASFQSHYCFTLPSTVASSHYCCPLSQAVLSCFLASSNILKIVRWKHFEYHHSKL